MNLILYLIKIMNILLKVEIGKNIGIGHLKRMESIYDSLKLIYQQIVLLLVIQ